MGSVSEEARQPAAPSPGARPCPPPRAHCATQRHVQAGRSTREFTVDQEGRTSRRPSSDCHLSCLHLAGCQPTAPPPRRSSSSRQRSRAARRARSAPPAGPPVLRQMSEWLTFSIAWHLSILSAGATSALAMPPAVQHNHAQQSGRASTCGRAAGRGPTCSASGISNGFRPRGWEAAVVAARCAANGSDRLLSINQVGADDACRRHQQR